MAAGFFTVSREVFDHPVVGRDPDRFRAWLWMISRACWKPTRFDINGKTVTLERGQFVASYRQLAEELGWSRSATERFLTRLKTETMIETQTGTGKMVITICNYCDYQIGSSETGTPSGTATGTGAGQERDTKEEVNKGIKDNKGSADPDRDHQKDDQPNLFPSPASSPSETPKAEKRKGLIALFPDWIEEEVAKGFLENRKLLKKPLSERAVTLLVGSLTKIRDAGLDPNAALDLATEKGWQTVKLEYVERRPMASHGAAETPAEKIRRELRI